MEGSQARRPWCKHRPLGMCLLPRVSKITGSLQLSSQKCSHYLPWVICSAATASQHPLSHLLHVQDETSQLIVTQHLYDTAWEAHCPLPIPAPVESLPPSFPSVSALCVSNHMVGIHPACCLPVPALSTLPLASWFPSPIAGQPALCLFSPLLPDSHYLFAFTTSLLPTQPPLASCYLLHCIQAPAL